MQITDWKGCSTLLYASTSSKSRRPGEIQMGRCEPSLRPRVYFEPLICSGLVFRAPGAHLLRPTHP